MKKRLKRIGFAVDCFILPLFVPFLLKFKGIRKIHWSFDDVEYNIDSDSYYISSKMNACIKALSIPVTCFLYKLSGRANIVAEGNVRFGPHSMDVLNGTTFLPFTTCYARFHGYRAQLQDLAKWKDSLNGNIGILLCAHDSRRLSYDLNKNESATVNESYFLRKNGLIYRKTNVRLEFPIFIQLLLCKKTETLVVFGHEWGIDSWMNNAMRFVECCKKSGIEFLT